MIKHVDRQHFDLTSNVFSHVLCCQRRNKLLSEALTVTTHQYTLKHTNCAVPLSLFDSPSRHLPPVTSHFRCELPCATGWSWTSAGCLGSGNKRPVVMRNGRTFDQGHPEYIVQVDTDSDDVEMRLYVYIDVSRAHF